MGGRCRCQSVPWNGRDTSVCACYLGWEPSKRLELDRFFEQASDHAPADPRSRQEAITVYGLHSSSTLFLFGSSQCKYVHIECQQAGLHFTSPAEENSLGVATC